MKPRKYFGGCLQPIRQHNNLENQYDDENEETKMDYEYEIERNINEYNFENLENSSSIITLKITVFLLRWLLQ